MNREDNETSLVRTLLGIFMIISGTITFKTWIGYPTPEDFWGNIFMNFGLVYPIVGIVIAFFGAYIITTTSYPSNRKEIAKFVGDNDFYLLVIIWAIFVVILPLVFSKNTAFILVEASGILLLIYGVINKTKK